MRWRYKLKEKSERIFIYAYSRETSDLDGLITYDVEKQTASIMRPSSLDRNSKKAQTKALQHFATVVEKGFPEEQYICCG